jgi:RHS repeat-associated protein
MVAVNYLWNPINDNIVREFDDAGNSIAEYTTEPDLYGNVVSQYRGGQTSYLVSDGQGNATELTNDAGNVTDTIRYSAFGEITERTGNTEIPFQYGGKRGYYSDGETGSYSIRERPLISSIGRWTCPDPLREVIDVPRLGIGNVLLEYGYCHNLPTTCTDPSGLIEGFAHRRAIFPWIRRVIRGRHQRRWAPRMCPPSQPPTEPPGVSAPCPGTYLSVQCQPPVLVIGGFPIPLFDWLPTMSAVGLSEPFFNSCFSLTLSISCAPQLLRAIELPGTAGCLGRAPEELFDQLTFGLNRVRGPFCNAIANCIDCTCEELMTFETGGSLPFNPIVPIPAPGLPGCLLVTLIRCIYLFQGDVGYCKPSIQPPATPGIPRSPFEPSVPRSPFTPDVPRSSFGPPAESPLPPTTRPPSRPTAGPLMLRD